MLKIDLLKKIIPDLINYLDTNEISLKSLNKRISNDTEFAINYDFNYIRNYLDQYIQNIKKDLNSKRLSPKGDILIILSYNEPFLMSISPILNALVAGNNVWTRQSRKSLNFFSKIWLDSGIKDKYNLSLNIFHNSREELEELIGKMNAVYFFGGYVNAKEIARICADNLIEYYPEIEAADFQIVNYKKPEKITSAEIEKTIHDSLLHTGQSCQRIQGVFVNEKVYEKYMSLFINTCNYLVETGEILKYIPKDYKPVPSLLENYKKMLKEEDNIDIYEINNGFPQIVTNANPEKSFINSAQFIPTIWIKSYSSKVQLLDWIAKRKFRLGLNIISDNKAFISEIIASTNYSRYTINTSHSFVRYYEGWGGVAPTGFNGYSSWLHHFSNNYFVLKEE